MPPFLRSPKQFLLTGLLWSPVCFWTVSLLKTRVGLEWEPALVWMLPAMMLELVICLSLWFLCRMTVKLDWNVAKTAWLHVSAATLLSAVWIFLIMLYTQVMEELFGGGTWNQRFIDALPLLAAVGFSLYFIAALTHYLSLSVERRRGAEQEALKQQVLVVEAELKALKATVHPHFLFNCLNLLGPLMKQSTEKAAQVVEQLSEFLLYSMRYGKKETVTVGEEVEHIKNYLGIESVRLGERLKFEIEAASETLEFPMLPLTLLPLVENAIKHGINQRIQGGVIRVVVKKEKGGIAFTVVNPWEAPVRKTQGQGLGLETLKQRFAAYYGSSATVGISKDATQFRVELKFPLSPTQPPGNSDFDI